MENNKCQCPDWLDDIWAKSPVQPNISGETLFSHTFEVLKRLAELKKLRPNLAETIGFPKLWNCLFWACMIHDFGKAALGFQQMLRQGGKTWGHRHEVLSLAFVDWLDGLSEEEKYWIAAAVAYHHKEGADLSDLTLVIDGSEDDPVTKMITQLKEVTLQKLWRWLAEYSNCWINELGFTSCRIDHIKFIQFDNESFSSKAYKTIRYYLNKLTVWQETGNNISEFRLSSILLRGHVISSDHVASAHVEIPPSPVQNPEKLINHWNKSIDSLYPHQKESVKTKGSAVLIAPTGSGKTEAAILWACSQTEQGKAMPRLIYCLPYQASMNAMYERLTADSFPGAVGLEHSRSILVQYRRYLEEKLDNKVAAKLAKWEKTLARLYCYPVRVLSPYQILKATYRLKGYETLLTDCFNAAFILDEIHAYAPRRLAQIFATVKYLRETYHAKFFVMSATLPGIVIEKLEQILGNYRLIKATDEVFEKFRRHRLFIRPGDLTAEDILGEIELEARSGKKVLICCNTIKRTQQVYQQLKDKLGQQVPIMLLHGRFNNRDRTIKERDIIVAAGGSESSEQSLVIVATQVVEVSLNIDLDVLYSDPAPLEALVQRFGRINRRRIYEWAPVYVFTQPCDGAVYEQSIVEQALIILQDINGQFIDEKQITTYLDNIYQDKIAENWNQNYLNAFTEFNDVCISNLKAFAADKFLEDEFYKAFDSIEVLPMSLKDEYIRFINKNDPLSANELFVSLGWKQFDKLAKKRRVIFGAKGQPNLVNLSYDSEYGLE
ncbi:hypothetical protein SCACP_39110 [Sporomusa carbonis]|uniref:CRISPR-associated helicase Cas3' n=1 Tax=Sporomusa carbonis TaxID=3076075 RepID=UPI003A752256